MTALTDLELKKLVKNPPSKRVTLKDGAVDGLEWRVGPRGKPTCSLRLRVRAAGGTSTLGTALNGDRHHRVPVGAYPEVTLARAREIALGLVAANERGENPILQRSEARTDRNDTVAALIDGYVNAMRQEDKRSWKLAESALRLHVLPVWGERLSRSITEAEADALVSRIRARRRVARNGEVKPSLALAHNVRRFGMGAFNWGRRGQRLTFNPFEHVKTPLYEVADRVLSLAEARAIYAAAEVLGAPWTAAIRLLMLTGCRKMEVCAAKREWITENGDGIIVPKEFYKTKKPFLIVLSPPAKAILDDVAPGREGNAIFSTTEGRISIWSINTRVLRKLKRASEELLGNPIEPFSPHDFRRTVDTHLRRLKIRHEVVEAVLGHAVRGVQRHYNHYDYADDKLEALTRWAAELLPLSEIQPMLLKAAQVAEAEPAPIFPTRSDSRRMKALEDEIVRLKTTLAQVLKT